MQCETFENVFGQYEAREKLYTITTARLCKKYGLTHMEFTVLMFLANHPQFDTAVQIVKYRHLTKSHVSISVRGLQEKGLLKGEYCEPDHRTVHLKVLDAAKPVIDEGRAAQEAFVAMQFQGFSKEEFDLFVRFIKRINTNVDQCIREASK